MSMGNAVGDKRRILILGGTAQARQLATALGQTGHAVTTSLAGRTATPTLPAGEIRIGGFGGVEGLAAYMRQTGTDLIVDATHPFAARISANAAAASQVTGIPLIRLERPQWQKPEGAIWVEVPDMASAVAALPAGARVLLTIGRQDLAPFFPRTDCHFIARMIDIPEGLPATWTIIAARGPFTQEAEEALLGEHKITHLVSKNAGAAEVAAKLDAAARLAIPVVMVARPALPPAQIVASVPEALEAIGRAFRSD